MYWYKTSFQLDRTAFWSLITKESSPKLFDKFIKNFLRFDLIIKNFNYKEKIKRLNLNFFLPRKSVVSSYFKTLAVNQQCPGNRTEGWGWFGWRLTWYWELFFIFNGVKRGSLN
jgi:hypothetical protein